jgi:hypothetical protein
LLLAKTVVETRPNRIKDRISRNLFIGKTLLIC